MQNSSRYPNFIKGKEQKKRFSICFLLFACLFIMIYSQAVYAAAPLNLITINIEQLFNKQSSSTDVNDEFSYELVALDTGNPMPAGSVGDVYRFKISGTESYALGPIEFLQEGIYFYELKNVPPATKLPQYTYDEEVYTIRITVTLIENHLAIAKISVNNSEDEKTATVQFTQGYKALPSDPKEMVDPPVKKTVVGSPNGTSIFRFTLTAKPKSNPMPEGSEGGIKTVSTAGPGEVEFGTWSYDEEGTYEYVIAEIDKDNDGYEYDRIIYTITDVVKEEKGVLKVYRTVRNANNKQVESLTFINEYKGGIPENVPGPGSKSGPKTGDDTSFSLYVASIIIASIMMIGCMISLRQRRVRVLKQSRPIRSI